MLRLQHALKHSLRCRLARRVLCPRLHSLAHARRANFNADGAWAEYACQFLSNCAAAQIQLVPEQCEPPGGASKSRGVAAVA